MNKEFKDGHSLVWDDNKKFREQKWPELRERIEATQGGVGVIADDFIEMLRYRPAPFREKAQVLRDAFADLTRDARSSEDLNLLADILAYMMREPGAANLDGAWFIYYLEGHGSRDIDVERAAGVINRLHTKSPQAAQELCRTLSSYLYGEDQELVIDLILNTNRLSAYVIDSLKKIHLNPPRNGERLLISYPHLFLSYSRSNIEMMRKVRAQIIYEGFKVWTDERLKPGTAEWQQVIETAIKDSGGLVVLMTPQSKASTWVNHEIDRALHFAKCIYPVLAAGDDDSAVPARIANIQRVDIRDDMFAAIRSLGSAVRTNLTSEATLVD